MRHRTGLFSVAFAVVVGCSGRRPVVTSSAPASDPVTVDAGAPVLRTSACAAVLCAEDTRCEETHGVASCVPIMRPRRAFCGGIAAIRCADGGRCVDAPDDDCDPARGGRDCGGICVAESADAGR